MKAFHNDKKVKDKYLRRVRAHRKADEIIKGKYWEDGKGCAVGCTLHSGNHIEYETTLGIPLVLAYLEDRIFEGMSGKKAKNWPVKFLSAIKVGADLSKVWAKWCLWNLENQKKYCVGSSQVIEAIDQVRDVYLKFLEYGSFDISTANSARSAARSAWSAESAAGSAANSAWSAESAARSAESAAWSAESAAWSAESAAWSAGSAAWSARSAGSAESAAWSAAYDEMAEKLLEFLKEAK